MTQDRLLKDAGWLLAIAALLYIVGSLILR